MSITVITPGLLTTVQDLGRYGYQKYGVIVSGAMDTYSMRLSNIIVGNSENEGVLEITLTGPALHIPGGNLISITGANLSPSINDKKVPMGRPIYIYEDSLLKFGKCKSGCRCYLSIAGGIDIPVLMGSKSTYLRGKLGGKEGRAIQKNDVLELGDKSEIAIDIINKLRELRKDDSFTAPKWYVKDSIIGNCHEPVIRVFEDRQFRFVSEDSIKELFNSPFTIDTKSDRMGYRLKGPEIRLKENIEMISEEVSMGTIQLPPDGNPIILLTDRATAGGYPKIAHVILCDIQKLVQLKPSEKIRFLKITLKEAENLHFKREKYINELKKSVKLVSM